MIFSDHLFTGDGIGDGAATCCASWRTPARSSSELAAELVTYPQMLVNVRVKREDGPAAGAGDRRLRCARSKTALDGHGRVLVRYSGTEPLLRIMIEGKDQARSRRGRMRSPTP